MMGCAQIQPLMYFQLNNIPLFRGAYQIINVEHNITPGDMTTKFKGVRINRTKIPLIKTGINVNDLNTILSKADDITLINKNYNSELLFGDSSKISINKNIIDSVNTQDWDYNSFSGKCTNTIIDWDQITSYIPSSGKTEAFNLLYPELKHVIYGISKRLDNENIIMKVISMARNDDSNSKSDHNNDIGDNASNIRKQVKITINGTEITATKRACAIDIKGCTYGGQNVDISIFHLIALEYTPYINQLIWEDKTGNVNTGNIGNCIHFASYGYNKGKKEIFYAIHNGVKTVTEKANNSIHTGDDYLNTPPTNLPIMFIKTLLDLSKNDEIYNTVKLINFDEKPTRKHLEKWYNKLTT
jgi:hypothetical protein